MTTHDTNTRSTPHGGDGQGMILFGAVSVALISTAAAYQAMVGFGSDVLAMGAINAWAFAGVFELSLVTVALMARQAATQDRPARTLLTLTWVLSALSGFFAGWHEIHLGHPATAAGFRFIVPLLAALMWHLALVGDRHLAMERSWSDLRMGARMHALFRARVARRRAIVKDDGSRRARRRIAQANARWERAEDVALRTVPPLQMRRHVTEWAESFEAVEGAREPADRFAVETELVTIAGNGRSHLVDVMSAHPMSAHPEASVSAQALTPALTGALIDERSTAQGSAHPSVDDERSAAHDDAQQSGSMSAHDSAHTGAHTGERPQVEPSAQAELSAHGERSTAQQTPVSATAEPATTSAHDTRAVSARVLEAAHGERSADAGQALTDAQPASRLRAVPSAPTPVPAGPGRDAIVDAMLAEDESVTGVQVARRLGLAEQSGRRELKAARERAAAARAAAEVVNQ